MHRRDALGAMATLGAASLIDPLSARPPARPPVQDQAIVVEGLIAGGLRLPHLKAQQAGGVHCGMASCPAEMNGWSRELKFLDAHSKEVVQAKSVADIRKARTDGRVAHVYGWQSAEGLGAAFNGTMGSVDTPLRAFYEMGLRSCGIAYNVANVFGGGCLEPTTPLSRAGKRLVEEIHKLRIVLDVGGHTGEQTSLDAIGITSGLPVVCSHTNVAAIADNPRCISDRLIDAIAGTGGVVGLTAVNDFHVRSRRDTGSSPRVGVEKYIEQFEYVRKRVGVDHIGLGPDFVDGLPLVYEAVNREVITRDMIGDGTWYYVKGFETAAELPNVVAAFKARGWSQPDIDKVMGGNWLRVWSRVWGA
ncbi:MAG TPA: membrane dipeptidase [Gemmatimonadales bacterium]|nr:membrane dipeptidase [Gemmatimonadales bacterium]